MPKHKNAADRLSDYLEMVPPNYKNLHQHDVKVNAGHAFLTGIVNNKHMSISRLHLTGKGISSDCHTHDEAETFILDRGSPYYMEIEGLGKLVTVSKSNSCHIPPNKKHRLAGTDGESWSIIVLIPGSETFPKGLTNGK